MGWNSLRLSNIPHTATWNTHLLPLVPSNSLLKLDRAATKDIQCTANSQVHSTATQLLHQFQVLQVPSTARVSDRDSTDGRQEFDKLGVDTSLLAFDIRGVNEEFRTVRFEECDVFFGSPS